MKKGLALVAAVALAAVLSGCSVTSNPKSEKGETFLNVKEITVTRADGTSMPCIIYDRGIDCDWDSDK